MLLAVAPYCRRLGNNTSAGKAVDLEKSVRARNEMTKRLQKRHQTELGSLHSIAIQLNGRALAKKHDQGAALHSHEHHPLGRHLKM